MAFVCLVVPSIFCCFIVERLRKNKQEKLCVRVISVVCEFMISFAMNNGILITAWKFQGHSENIINVFDRYLGFSIKYFLGAILLSAFFSAAIIQTCKNRNSANSVYYWMAAIFTLLRFITTVILPNYHNLSQVFDDTLYLESARSILQGDWLGDYNQMRLIKYQSISILYALIHVLHIPFVISIFFLNFLAAMVTAIAFRPVISKTWVRLAIFVFVLYLPLNVSVYNYSVARSSVTPPVIEIIIGCLLGIYTRSGYSVRRQLKWFLTVSVFFAFYFWLREESITLIPLLFGCCFIFVLRLLILGKESLRQVARKAILWAIPVLITGIYLVLISSLNMSHYGVFTLSDRTAGSFKEAVDYITSIEDGNPERDETVCVTSQMRDLAIANSATLMGISEDIEAGWEAWSEMRGRSDGQMTGDDYIWVLRGAAAKNGIYENAQTAQSFWNAVKEELELAFSEGHLKKSKGIKLSFSYAPLKKDDIGYMARYAWSCIRDISSYNTNVKVTYVAARTDEAIMAEELLHTRYVYENMKSSYIWSEDVLEMDVNLLRWISKPYWLLGKYLFWTANLIFVIWPLVMVVKRCGYEMWEPWIVTLGFGVVLFLTSFAVCCFTDPWYRGALSVYHINLLPMIVAYELMVYVFGLLCLRKCMKRSASSNDSKETEENGEL